MTTFSSIVSWWRKQWADSFPAYKKERKSIVLNEGGFELIDPLGDSFAVRWEKVTVIRAFKRDLFTVDLICFDFTQKDADWVLEINEQMTGFDLLVEELAKVFPSFDENWRTKVVLPVFVPNLTELWKKKCDGHRPPLH